MPDDSNPRSPGLGAVPGWMVAAAFVIASLSAMSIFTREMSREIVIRLLAEDGPVAVLWILGMTGWGSAILRALRLDRGMSTSLYISICGAAGIGLGASVALLLGLAGWLSAGTAWGLVLSGIMILGIAFATLAPEERLRHVQAVKTALFGRTRAGLLWLIGAPVVGIVISAMFVVPGALWQRLPESEPHGYDVLIYHLQAPREWFDAGRIVELPHNIYSYLPFNVEMHYLLAMHLRSSPLKGMFVAQVMHAMMMGLAVVAVFACARRTGGASAIGACVLMLCLGWTATLAPIAYNEAGAILMLAAVCAMLQHAIRTSSTSAVNWNSRSMLLIGLLLGFAAGAKLTAGVVAVGFIVGTGVLALVSRRTLLPVAMSIVGGAIAMSPWIVRNAAWTGNPVFPERMEWFGGGHLSDGQIGRWRAAHSAPASSRGLGDRFRKLVRDTAGDWRFAFGFVPLGLAALVVAHRRELILPLAAGVIALSGFWLISSHLQSRFLVLAVPLLACAIGMVDAKLWRAGVIVLAVGAGVLSVQKTWAPIREANLLVGLENMDAWSPSVMTDAINLVNATSEPVYLVGEGRVFWIPGPSRRLHYRTVFDVPFDESTSAAEKWIDGAPDDALVFVNWNELRRLAQTYGGLGWVPDAGDRFENEVIRAGALREIARMRRTGSR